MHCTLLSWVTAYVAVKILISQVNAACSIRPKVPVSPQETLAAQGKQQALETTKIYHQKAWLESKQFLLQISAKLWAHIRKRGRSCGLMNLSLELNNIYRKDRQTHTQYQHRLT